MKLNLETVESFATDVKTAGSQAHVGRELRAAGYRFANKEYRALWNYMHGAVTAVDERITRTDHTGHPVSFAGGVR